MTTLSLLQIDGSQGEGGGQVLRTSLALSVITGQPFHITGIRANRGKPGLMRQHLTAVRAAAEINGATLQGAELNSQDLVFTPAQAGALPGTYHFSIGTAGSTSLVLQTVVLPLLMAKGPSSVTLEGGTHNPMAPAFPYLSDVFVPLLRRMGASLELAMERPGFAPAGGGRITFNTSGNWLPTRLELPERGPLLGITATAFTAGGLSGDIAKRELKLMSEKLTIAPECLLQRTLSDSTGPGNFVCIAVKSEHITELFTSIGEQGKRAEAVANEAVNATRDYLTAGVPVGLHLADQLLLPMALGKGGKFTTTTPTLHTSTNLSIIQRFLNVAISAVPTDDERMWEIVVGEALR